MKNSITLLLLSHITLLFSQKSAKVYYGAKQDSAIYYAEFLTEKKAYSKEY
ncbi:hypothetical protein [Chryseobacterium sp.]|uniref:hypothetical protein n=1 Tax=Chryseobacterium sp. TaxID=1871047 RepID=UPI003890B1A1